MPYGSEAQVVAFSQKNKAQGDVNHAPAKDRTILNKGPFRTKKAIAWGVDGVGVIFPFFYALFIFLRIFSLFFRFSLLLLRDKGEQQQNLLRKRGISLRPRLHRPRAKLPESPRSFEKGLADRGGWRKEILPTPEIETSFLHPFSYAPLGEEGHISGELFAWFWGFV